jgi:hypothetical protein
VIPVQVPQAYADYLEAAQLEIREKQARVQAEYGIERLSGLSVDYGAGTLAFLDGSVPKVEATIQPIAMHVRATGQLMWAWASPELAPAMQEAAARMKDFATMSGLPIFARPSGISDETGAWEIIALACKLFDSVSANRVPHGEVDSYVLLTSLRKLDD